MPFPQRDQQIASLSGLTGKAAIHAARGDIGDFETHAVEESSADDGDSSKSPDEDSSNDAVRDIELDVVEDAREQLLTPPDPERLD